MKKSIGYQYGEKVTEREEKSIIPSGRKIYKWLWNRAKDIKTGENIQKIKDWEAGSSNIKTGENIYNWYETEQRISVGWKDPWMIEKEYLISFGQKIHEWWGTERRMSVEKRSQNLKK